MSALTVVNSLIPTNSLNVNQSENKRINVFSEQVTEVKNITSPLVFNNNTKYEVITIGTPKEIKTPSLSTFPQENPIKISENILEVKNDDMDHDKSEIVRNYHFGKDQDIEKQNKIKDESKSNEYADKRNEKVENKLSKYRELYSTSIDENDNKNLDNRYNLNSSDFSIIKNEIENKELSKKEKMSIIKKHLQDNDSAMKNIGFFEKVKNIFGKSNKINEIRREQKTDTLNILNRLNEKYESINNK